VRPGEFCALEWPDFNFETRDVHIYKTLHFPQGGSGAYQLTPPKTTGSVRTFDVDDFIVEMFKRLKVKQSARHKRYKELHDDFVETQFILTNNNGTPFTNWKLVNRMARLMKLTNIKKHATPHIFRHTHITMLIEASIASGSQIDLKTIMKRVGHDDAKTTLKIYTHVTERMMQSSSDKLKIHFQNILNPKDLPRM
jgi:integrase